MSRELTEREVQTVIGALYRAIDWSDVYDNGEINGERWMRRELQFLKRCQRLLEKLTQPNRRKRGRKHVA